METTVVYWILRIMEKEMETTIVYRGYTGFYRHRLKSKLLVSLNKP